MFFAILKRLFSCFNLSLALKNKCFLLIIFIKVYLFYYIVPELFYIFQSFVCGM